VLESLTVIMMLSIGSLFVFLYRMDRHQRRTQAAADAKRETPGIGA
jgi:hypothetical protein